MVAPALLHLLLLSIAMGAAAESLDFKFRPAAQSTKAFPNPSSFKEVTSRRLNAEEGDPNRRLFEAEEGGHKFVYEFAGESTAEQVLDVDKEQSIEKIACRPLRDEAHNASSVMWLRWDTASALGSNASARKPLKPGDIVTGGPGWNCLTGPNSGFLRQVLSVRSHATRENPTTEITTRDVSPLQVFRDLYVDFTWMRPASHQDGRMLANDWDVDTSIVDFNFNYDADTKQAKMPIDMGLLTCDNCYAYFRPKMKFKLVTSDWSLKEAVLRFDIEAGISIDVAVHPRGIKAVETSVSGWERILGESGPDFLRDLLAVTVPLFIGIADILNLVAHPITEMFSQFGDDLIDLIQEARLSASMSLLPDETFMELGWKEGRGVYTEMGFNLRNSLKISGIPLVNEIFVGLKLCAGVAVVVGNSEEPLVDLKLCPEVLLGKSAVTKGMVIPSLAQTEYIPDKQVCITFKSFETDLDLDTFWGSGIFAHDEPAAQVCWQGKCVATSVKYFNGNTVTWNEEKCMDIVHSHFFGDEAGSLAFVVKEHDPFGHSRQYTQQQQWKLPYSCAEECEMNFDQMPIPPSLEKYGSIAKLKVQVKFKELNRRLTSNESVGCGPRQSAVLTNLALGGNFGGVTFPSLFHAGQREQVEPPAAMPVMRPKDAESACVDVENLPNVDSDDDNKTLVNAAGPSCKFHLMSMILATLVTLGR